jgi:hypothetical protein
LATLILDLSCSAKAEHPVNTVGAVITGSPACAGDDRVVLSAPPLHPARQIIEIDLELLGLTDFVFEHGNLSLCVIQRPGDLRLAPVGVTATIPAPFRQYDSAGADSIRGNRW